MLHSAARTSHRGLKQWGVSVVVAAPAVVNLLRCGCLDSGTLHELGQLYVARTTMTFVDAAPLIGGVVCSYPPNNHGDLCVKTIFRF